MSTAKGEETRRRIVWAAWELTSRRGAEQLLAGVSLREVAAEAGLSPSALTYHFPTVRDLAFGMVDEIIDSLAPEVAESVEVPFRGVEFKSMAETVGEAAAANWAVITTPEEVELERRFARCHAATGSDADGIEVALRLARFHRSWVEQMSAIYEQAATAASLRLVDPFTFRELATLFEATFDGFQRQWMCDPRLVRDGLMAEVAVAIASVMLTPAGQEVALSEVSAGLPRGVSDPGCEELDPDAATAVGVAGLFASGFEGVTLTEVADALGWDPAEVLDRLGPVRRVAALSFARHVAGIEGAALRRRGAEPGLALSDALFELARCVQGDLWCAQALLFERLDSRAGGRTGRVNGAAGGTDVLRLVALDPIFEGLVGAAGYCDGRMSGREAAAMLVDTVLCGGVGHPGVALGRIVEPALRMVAAGSVDSSAWSRCGERR